MHFSAALTFSVLAGAVTAYTYPDHVPLHRRQAPGTPSYECHASCGGVITISRTEDYCSSSNFTTQLEECLNCANEFGIWQYYGNSVGEAATACGVEAEPVAAQTASSTAAAAESASPATSASVAATETEAAESGIATASSAASPSATSESDDEATETESAEQAPATYTGIGTQNVLGYGMAMLPIGVVAILWLCPGGVCHK